MNTEGLHKQAGREEPMLDRAAMNALLDTDKYERIGLSTAEAIDHINDPDTEVDETARLLEYILEKNPPQDSSITSVKKARLVKATAKLATVDIRKIPQIFNLFFYQETHAGEGDMSPLQTKLVKHQEKHTSDDEMDAFHEKLAVDIYGSFLEQIARQDIDVAINMIKNLDLRFTQVDDIVNGIKDGVTDKDTTELLTLLVKNYPDSFKPAVQLLRLSSEKISAFLDLFDQDEQRRILDLLAVKMPRTDRQEDKTAEHGDHKELDAFRERNEREDVQFLERFKQAGDELYSALRTDWTEQIERAMAARDHETMQYCTERFEAERERRKIEKELMSDIKAFLEFGFMTKESDKDTTSSQKLILRFPERRMPALYKPESGESNMTRSIKPGTFFLREWLVFQIDRMLELDVVPTTVLRTGPKGPGSVQDWKHGDLARSLDMSSGGSWKTVSKPDQVMRVAFLDLITRNTDRHQNNFLVVPDGKLWAIDNALTFPSEIIRKGNDALRSRPLDHVRGQRLDPESRYYKKALRFVWEIPLQQALQKCFDAVFEYESDIQFDLFKRRIDEACSNPLPQSELLI